MNSKHITILDKYIFSQVTAASLVILFLFIIVWMAPEKLVDAVKDVFSGELTVLQASMELFYELPKVLSQCLPISILVGALFTFDKLSKDSELAILRSSGLSYMRILRPVILLGVIYFALCAYTVDQLVPWASAKTGENSHYNEHFVYLRLNDDKTPKQGIIVSNFTQNGIKNVIVTNFKKDEYSDIVCLDNILFADYALNKDAFWILPQVTKYAIDKNGVYQKIADVKNVKILEGEDAKDIYNIMSFGTKRERAFTNLGLFEYVKLLKKKDFSDEFNFNLSKLYQRFFHPFTCVLFAILGALLGYAPPRSVRMVGFIIAAGLLFGYYITLPAFGVLAEKSILPPFICASFPTIVFIASIFIVKKNKDL